MYMLVKKYIFTQSILYTNTNAQVHAVKVDLAWDVQTLVNHLQLPNLLPIQPDDLGQVFAPGIEHNNIDMINL